MFKALWIAALCLGCVIAAGACTDSMDRNNAGEPCGSNVCTGDTFCCNESCGVCAPNGGACTLEFCGKSVAPPEELVSSADPTDESLVIVPRQCGNTVCTGNTHCCNASCGICVPPRGVCTQQVCSATD
jgi:hypothetical protein